MPSLKTRLADIRSPKAVLSTASLMRRRISTTAHGGVWICLTTGELSQTIHDCRQWSYRTIALLWRGMVSKEADDSRDRCGPVNISWMLMAQCRTRPCG